MLNPLIALWQDAMNAIDAWQPGPTLTWMSLTVLAALFLSAIVGVSGWLFERASEAWWRRQHPAPRAAGCAKQRRRAS
jgi:hypothetical protein